MKNTKHLNTISIAFFGLAIFLFPEASKAQLTIDPNFNPSRIIEDSDYLNSNSMSLADIQTFLTNKGSFLANYSTANAYGETKSAAEIIYDASNNNYDCSEALKNDTLSDNPTKAEKEQKCRHISTVNPKLLLVTLQKESSLIEGQNPSSGRLNAAMGYACPDSGGCSPYYAGFGKQVNGAAWQFWRYYNYPDNYNFKAGNTYIVQNTLDPYCSTDTQTMIVTPQNKATAALYNYTPHVFNGNYNVYKLWNRYFPKIDRIFPDGSLIQASGNPAIWLISEGRKRLFTNYSAFISRYKTGQIVTVDPGELDNYQTGDPIKFANYSLVQTPDKKIYLLVDKEKRQFASQAVFKKIGFNPSEIEQTSVADIASYKNGNPITATSTYVTGILLQDSKKGDIFYVENGTKAPVDKVLLSTKYKDKKITKKTTKELATYKLVAPILLDDGQLVKTENFPTVYLISGGKKRPFASDTAFTKLNYNPKNVITVSSQFLYNYAMGDMIQ